MGRGGGGVGGRGGEGWRRGGEGWRRGGEGWKRGGEGRDCSVVLLQSWQSFGIMIDMAMRSP